MFKFYDSRQQSSGSHKSERIYRLEKELKLAKKQEAYRATMHLLRILVFPLSSTPLPYPAFFDNSLSRKIDGLERELAKEKKLSGCSSKDTATKGSVAKYLS